MTPNSCDTCLLIKQTNKEAHKQTTNKQNTEFLPVAPEVEMLHLSQQYVVSREHKQQVHCDALSFDAPVKFTKVCWSRVPQAELLFAGHLHALFSTRQGLIKFELLHEP